MAQRINTKHHDTYKIQDTYHIFLIKVHGCPYVLCTDCRVLVPPRSEVPVPWTVDRGPWTVENFLRFLSSLKR